MSKFIVQHPRAVIAIVLLFTVIFLCGLRRGLSLDASPLGFIERSSQAGADFSQTRKEFGPDDYLVVAVSSEDIFTPENIARLRILHEKIERMSGVREVLSLINVPYACSVNGAVEANRLISSDLP